MISSSIFTDLQEDKIQSPFDNPGVFLGVRQVHQLVVDVHYISWVKVYVGSSASAVDWQKKPEIAHVSRQSKPSCHLIVLVSFEIL